jgi:hypothetical protein
VYTPQVRVSGRDWRRWPDLPSAATALTLAAAPTLQLARDGDAVVVQVDASTRSGALAGYWAVLEDDHETRVRAGENAGSTLRHHHVVRLVPARGRLAPPARRTARAWRLSRGVPAHPRRVAFVLVDAATQRPLQAAVLAC